MTLMSLKKHRMWTLVPAASAALLFSALALADGSITGHVKFDGDIRAPKRIDPKADAYCVASHASNPLTEETFVFNKEKSTLCNVLVWVSSPVSGTPETPSAPVKIEQHGCQYVPHVVGIMVGQKLEITNNDQTAHNLKLVPEKNPAFNESQPQQGMVKSATFTKPEFAPPMPLKCDVHAWMNAYIAVFEHPYFAVTDANGEFKIDGLPPGQYDLTVWHEFDKFAPVSATLSVDVKDGAPTEAEFVYKVKGK